MSGPPYGDVFGASQDASLAMRLAFMLRIPFDLVSCLAITALAQASLLVDPSREPLARIERPTEYELKTVDPTLAMLLIIRPMFPTWRRAMCELLRAAREAAWNSYETQLREASELVGGMKWARVAKDVQRWFMELWVLARKTHWRESAVALVRGGWFLAGRPVWRFCKRRLGMQTASERREDALARCRMDCEYAKVVFKEGHLDAALVYYDSALDALDRIDLSEGAKDSVPEEDAREFRTERVRVLVNVALCHKKQGKYDEAVEAATKALELQEDHVKALFFRGGALLAAGKAQEAERDLARVVEREPGNETAELELRRAQASMGRSRGSSAAQELIACVSCKETGKNLFSLLQGVDANCVLCAGTGKVRKARAAAQPLDFGLPPAKQPKLSRRELLRLLEEAVGVHGRLQQEINELARKIGGETRLTFMEAHAKVKELGLPKDPMEAKGLTEMDLPELLQEYETDEQVMVAAERLLRPASHGDPAEAERLANKDIIEFHQSMVKELRAVVAEFRALPFAERKRLSRKECEAAAELLVASQAQSRYQLRSEDVEQAVLDREEQLQRDPEFVEATEHLAALMQELFDALRPADLDAME